MEKKLEGQEDMAIKIHRPGEGICNNTKRNDDGNTGVDGGPRMVEGTYEDTKSRVLCGPGVSGESKLNVDLTQGSVFVPDKQKDLYKTHTPDIIERR